MSGHSKWSTIKHKKAATDAKRGKAFTRLAKEISIAARESGGDVNANPRLRLAVDKAKAANMPNDNVTRAIKRGTGELEGGELLELMYEGYGPNGVGVIVEVVTDNKNRAVSDIRHVLSKNGGSMAESGAVAWQFSRKGYIQIEEKVDQDDLFLIAADAGADDIQFGETTEIYCELDYFQAVQKALTENKISFTEAIVIYDPNNTVDLEVKDGVQIMKIIELLEELDDVQNVYSALEISDALVAEMEDDE